MKLVYISPSVGVHHSHHTTTQPAVVPSANSRGGSQVKEVSIYGVSLLTSVQGHSIYNTIRLNLTLWLPGRLCRMRS
ncbi:MAG: hypothetical protein ACTHJT_09175 [Cytophaga sp.]|uniref:hypothetical protein n=1 Tax=Cytophaga sp. TaxID=29535 RepID=UPI003F7D6721